MTGAPVHPAGQGRRLILLTQWFDPEPTFKGLLFARALQARGFAVEVVTGFPNYPGGKLYEGYRVRPIRRETIGGIAVTRLALYPSHGQSGVGRAFNYLSFMTSAFLYLTFAARRADVMYAYHPPMTVGLAAAAARIFRRTPLVLDIQDMWPETLAATGMVNSPRALSLIGAMCNWVYRKVSHIVVLSPGFAASLESKGVPAEKISVIYNWADTAALCTPGSAAPEGMIRPNRFGVLFAGNMGKAQALDTVIDAAKLIAAQDAPIDFIMLGGGVEVERLQQRSAAENIGNVRFLPQVPMTDVGRYLQAADCLLVHLRDDPLFTITVPSKTQAYMAVGKPILMGVAGDAAALVEQAGCGIVTVPEDAPQLAQAVLAMAALPPAQRAAMGAAGRDLYERELSLDAGVAKFEALFLRVCPKGPDDAG